MNQNCVVTSSPAHATAVACIYGYSTCLALSAIVCCLLTETDCFFIIDVSSRLSPPTHSFSETR